MAEAGEGAAVGSQAKDDGAVEHAPASLTLEQQRAYYEFVYNQFMGMGFLFRDTIIEGPPRPGQRDTRAWVELHLRLHRMAPGLVPHPVRGRARFERQGLREAYTRQ